MLSHQTATKNPANPHSTPNTQMVRVTMNNALRQPVCFSELMPDEYQNIRSPGAIYVEAFNEIFTEIADEKERIKILSKLNELLQKYPDIPCFLDTGYEDIETCKINAAKYLGNASKVAAQLSDQKTVFNFKSACAKGEIKTVYIGGVYGRACVWSAAREMAEEIIAMQLGDSHPNIRFRNLSNPFRFKYALIYPPITEGYQTGKYTFSRLLRFPETKCFPVDLTNNRATAKLEANLRRTNPGLIGEDYQDEFSDEDSENHGEIYNVLQQNHQCVDSTPVLKSIGLDVPTTNPSNLSPLAIVLSYSQLTCCLFASRRTANDSQINPQATQNSQPSA